jgi:hypothetical protein
MLLEVLVLSLITNITTPAVPMVEKDCNGVILREYPVQTLYYYILNEERLSCPRRCKDGENQYVRLWDCNRQKNVFLQPKGGAWLDPAVLERDYSPTVIWDIERFGYCNTNRLMGQGCRDLRCCVTEVPYACEQCYNPAPEKLVETEDFVLYADGEIKFFGPICQAVPVEIECGLNSQIVWFSIPAFLDFYHDHWNSCYYWCAEGDEYWATLKDCQNGGTVKARPRDGWTFTQAFPIPCSQIITYGDVCLSFGDYAITDDPCGNTECCEWSMIECQCEGNPGVQGDDIDDKKGD